MIILPHKPVNWRSPLNRGLTSWWKVIPNTRGSATFRDLAGRNTLTLTNSPTFERFKVNSHATGSLRFVAASSTEASCPFLASSWDGDNWSFGGWFHQPVIGSYTRYNSFVDSTTFYGGAGPSIWNDPGGALALVRGASIHFSTGYTLTAGVWTHIFFARAGTSLKCFINGIKVAEDAAFSVSYTGTDTLFWGKGENGYSEYYDGYVDDLRVYARGVNEAEAYELYRDSLGGHKDTLEWVPSRVLFLPDVAASGIAFDAASNSGYQAAASTYNWNHTCTGSNRFLAVDIALLSPGQSVTSITYNGVPLYYIGSRDTVTSLGRIECWGLIAPASGTNSIAVTLSGTIISAGVAVSYTGVNQFGATEAFNSNQATNVGAADATVTVTTVTDNAWVHAAVVTDDMAITAGQTARNNVSGAGGSGANEDTGPITPAGAQAMTYTAVDALATWSIAGYGIRPIGSSTPRLKFLTYSQAVNRAANY